MFSKLVRDFKISRNHKARVRSIVIRPNDEIVRTMDLVRSQLLEAERKEDKDKTLKFKSMLGVFEWLINNESKRAS